MGRSSVTIPFNPIPLKAALVEKGWTMAKVGELFGISRQAVNAWFLEERIPPRRLADIAQAMELEPNLIERILHKEESVKDLARENRVLREENYRLKQAIAALTSDAQPAAKEGE